MSRDTSPTRLRLRRHPDGSGAERDGTSRRPFLGFGILHAGNTALNMGFTLIQLLVLAHILPLSRYSEVVFLTSVGFYLQPLDQALGKASFVALRATGGSAGQARREVVATLVGQAVLLLAIALAVPCALEPVGSQAWAGDVLFLFLSLATNFWAFDLQSTAWALDLNLPFVRLALVHRSCHLAALALAYALGSFLLFGIVASGATLIAISVVGRLFATAGLFRSGARVTEWPAYLRIFGVSLLATATDLLVLNAPYALIAARFGIGPMLVVFDSVMKVARIAMAGARTLAEITLTRHTALVGAGDLGAARRLVWLVLAACVGATLAPALVVGFAGRTVFHILLGTNDVVPASAMAPAALVILASALYQPAVFFLSFSNKRRPVQWLGLGASGTLAAFATTIALVPLQPAGLLAAFGSTFLVIAVLATWLTDRLFQRTASETPALRTQSAAGLAVEGAGPRLSFQGDRS